MYTFPRLSPGAFALLFFLMPLTALRGQSVWADSIAHRLDMLRRLYQSENFELAQVNALSFGYFLQARGLDCPPDAIPLVNAVFLQNKDNESATTFLSQAESDAKGARVPAQRVALFNALEAAYSSWGMGEAQQRVHESKVIALGELQAQRQTESVRSAFRERDSLRYRATVLLQERQSRVYFDKQVLYAGIGVFSALLLLGVLAWNRRQRRWQAQWRKREQEIDLEKAAAGLALGPVVAYPSAQQVHQIQVHHESIVQTALLVEPNRPIAIYLKSLLSDRFQVDTVATANEAIMRANDMLPDLIICDAVLNGHSGIEVVRQLKMGERTSHIPMVLLVEQHGPDALLDARRAGADTWFVRPLPNDDLNAQIAQLLESRKQQHQLFNRHLHLYFTDWRPQLPDAFLQKTLELIEENLSDPDYSPEDLAKKLQLSRPHLVRKMMALTGKEPQQLIRELRLEKAKVLLEKRAAAPQVVSELVGFSSTGSFVKAFRDYFGDDALLLRV
jgi:AraC-like DNA-binding protein/CheY-like chemotaxis protein